ncbi:hypothetical protein IQ268_29510 [Oculatella sp. LEGE 06141]|nr:hypothetical protein [Oculatella sp. LEGE 06141]MBE9182677.1 hypothetical protein [Oculatella sp. LEGE 06141]
MSPETTPPNSSDPYGVQHDSETPLPKKPSFLFIVTTSLGVITIILLAVGAYYGVSGA